MSFRAFERKYSDLSDKELLSNFRSEIWSNLKKSDRIAISQEVENRNAAQQGRTPCRVVPANGRHGYGAYTSSSSQIEVTVKDNIRDADGKKVKNNSYEVLDTIYHEGQHAHQDNCVRNEIDGPNALPNTTRDFCKVENSRGVYPRFDEKGNQISGTMEYDNCTCEIDSNNAATKKVMESKELFRDDPEYEKYLEGREKYFDNVVNRDMSVVHMEQNESIDLAYDNGDLSWDQYEHMKQKEVHSSQPAFEESKQIAEDIKREKLELEQRKTQNLDNGEPEVETNQESLNEHQKEDIDSSNSSYDEDEDIEEEQGYRRR